MTRRGITLVETLVVMGIVGMLVALAMPAVQRLRGLADRVACQSQMRQIMVAMHHHHHDRGSFPPGAFVTGTPESRLSWLAHLLPYVEQTTLYRMALEDQRLYPGSSQIGLHRAQTTVIRLYTCPGDVRLRDIHADVYGDLGAFTSYVAAASVRHPTTQQRHLTAYAATISEITDGTANTIAFGERPPPDSFIAGWWYHGALAWGFRPLRGPNGVLLLSGAKLAPGNWPDCAVSTYTFGPGRLSNNCDRMHFWSVHGGGANFAFVDGSVRFVAYSAGSDLIAKLLSINGGETDALPD